MPLIYVTGVSGSGKSSVLCGLRSRGYTAYGVDEDGFADWIRRDTKAVDPFPDEDESLDMHAWFAEHDWVLNGERVSVLKSESGSDLIFLCGVSSRDAAAWHLFDAVVALIVDAGTIRHRIASRTNNQFGKSQTELEEILRSHAATSAEGYRALGAATVDATQPIAEVVDAVIAAAAAITHSNSVELTQQDLFQ